MSTHLLNLPEYPYRIKKREDQLFIFDNVRCKFVTLTPEEWVRQHVVHWLIREKGVSPKLVGLEKGHQKAAIQGRCDIVVYTPERKVWLLVECKSPQTALSDGALLQLASYNTQLQARFLMLTNGVQHYFMEWDGLGYRRFEANLPSYGSSR